MLCSEKPGRTGPQTFTGENVISPGYCIFPHTHVYTQMHLCVCVHTLTSLSMILSRSISVDANNIISLLLSEKYSTVYVYHIVFIHSSIDRYLGCFHASAIVNRVL